MTPEKRPHTLIVGIRISGDGIDIEELYDAVEKLPGVTGLDDIAVFAHNDIASSEVVEVLIPSWRPDDEED